MLFTYKAKLKNGDIFDGAMEFSDRYALSRELRARGSIPISITEKSGGVSTLNETFNKIFSKVKTDELIILTKNLSGMLKAGLSLYRALSVLEKQTKNPALKAILTSLGSDINMGSTLSSGLDKFPKVFSKLFVSMARAGEESGNLANALTDVGLNLDKAHSLNKKVKGALIYPGVILSAMVVVGILMFAFVVPTLAGTFRELGVSLPLSTQLIIALGNFFSNNLLLTFVLLIAVVGGMMALVRSSFAVKYVDFLVIKFPVIGSITRELNTARTARTMSSLLLSGVSITRAVEITEDVVQNVYYKKVLEQAKDAIERGAPFSEAFRAHPDLYPVMMSEMVQVGEETGKLSDMLLEVALFYESEIENKTRNLSTIIEPILMVLIGAGVGFFAISMISPLYSILNSIE
ncbi:MAG: type II secretion system F family protein [Candidatus Paceibacterota bacterium]